MDPGRLELPISSLQARRFPSKPQAQAWRWVRGAGSNRRSPGSQSGALPLSYREHMPDPCQGFEPRLAGSEPAVLAVGRTRNERPERARRDSNSRLAGSKPAALSAELRAHHLGCGRGTRTLDLVVMGHPLSPLSYPAPVGVEGETRTRKAMGQQALDLSRLPLRHFDIGAGGEIRTPIGMSLHGLSVARLPVAALRLARIWSGRRDSNPRPPAWRAGAPAV